MVPRPHDVLLEEQLQDSGKAGLVYSLIGQLLTQVFGLSSRFSLLHGSRFEPEETRSLWVVAGDGGVVEIEETVRVGSIRKVPSPSLGAETEQNLLSAEKVSNRTDSRSGKAAWLHRVLLESRSPWTAPLSL